MEHPQFAYTGASPEKGYVGFINIRKTDDGQSVIFSVRSEGEQPTSAQYAIPLDQAVTLLGGALQGLGGPPKHDYWRPGQADCPEEIKAGNGELHTLRCKRCGQDNPRSNICVPG
jgi:hypothetical protein